MLWLLAGGVAGRRTGGFHIVVSFIVHSVGVMGPPTLLVCIARIE